MSWIKATTLTAAILLLCSCGARDVQACEDFIRDGLRSPSTYKRMSLVSDDKQLNEEEFRELTKLPRYGTYTPHQLREVLIEYEAANAYGTPVRGTEICAFVLTDGELPSKAAMKADLALAKSARTLRDLQIAGAPSQAKYSCCL